MRFALAIGIGTSANADKAAITVALGMTPDQIRERSTASIPWSLVPIGAKRLNTGGALVTTPHRLVYEDQALRLVFQNAGNHRSMPTSLTVTDDSLTIVSVSALDEYVDVKA